MLFYKTAIDNNTSDYNPLQSLPKHLKPFRCQRGDPQDSLCAVVVSGILLDAGDLRYGQGFLI